MLKSFNELRKIDVTPYIKKRDGADYLPYTTVVDLLHSPECGAEKVFWSPLYNEKGSSLFMSEQTFVDNKGNVNRCYEVRIEIMVDDDVFVYSYPLTNGINPVKDNSLNQNVVFKAMQRAFVKAIAIRYGLGFSLWAKDELEETEEEDLYKHSLDAICTRFKQTYTQKLQKHMSVADIAKGVDMTEDEVKVLFSYFEILKRFEAKLQKL